MNLSLNLILNLARFAVGCRFCVMLVLFSTLGTSGRAEGGLDAGAKAYANAIAWAQSEITQGHFDEALEALSGTSESERGIEYDYLEALALAEGDATKLIKTIANPAVDTRYGVLNSASRQMVFICRDGGLRIHDLSESPALAKEVFHPDGAAIWRGVFSDDGETFLSGHGNGDVVVWDVASWSVRQTLPMQGGSPVRELASSPDGLTLVAESKQGLELWSLRGDRPEMMALIGKRFNFGEGLAFSPRGDLVATGGMFDIELHDAKTGESGSVLRHASYTMGLAFSADGNRIASAPRGNVNKFLGVFDVGSGERIFNAGPFQKYINGVAFSPDGNRIAATGCEKLFRIFDAKSGVVLLEIERPGCGTAPAFAKDGKLLGWSEAGGFCYLDFAK